MKEAELRLEEVKKVVVPWSSDGAIQDAKRSSPSHQEVPQPAMVLFGQALWAASYQIWFSWWYTRGNQGKNERNTRQRRHHGTSEHSSKGGDTHPKAKKTCQKCHVGARGGVQTHKTGRQARQKWHT